MTVRFLEIHPPPGARWALWTGGILRLEFASGKEQEILDWLTDQYALALTQIRTQETSDALVHQAQQTQQAQGVEPFDYNEWLAKEKARIEGQRANDAPATEPPTPNKE